MKIKGARDNFRIVVRPRGLGDFGSIRMPSSLPYGHTALEQKRMERDMEDRCNEIAADIRRHADNVSSVIVEFDQAEVCEHCGAEWTEKSPYYNGGCCAKDEEFSHAEVQP